MQIPHLFFVLLVLSLYSCNQPNQRLSLNGDDWKFATNNTTADTNTLNWQTATVPGAVQSDLLKLGLIPDPFLLNNEDSIQWISKKEWVYEKKFSVAKKQLLKKQHLLRFEGLDTYANVFFNDSLILKANNAFRIWEIDVSTHIKPENTLSIIFLSVDDVEKTKAAKLEYKLPESPRVFTRKPQFQYGWDWGPKIKTVGVWRDITLVSYNELRLEDAFIQTKTITDTTAKLTAVLNFQAAEYANCTVEIENKTTQKIDRFPAEVYGPSSQFTFNLNIQNPKLWWPHNLGKPFLYEYTIRIKQGNKVIDSIEKRVGIRNINLITKKDSLGESFFFQVNGKPVYMKGANYIPQHIMLPEVTREQRVKLIDDVVEANMNMLRVWGGGTYEDESFYALCDEKGILIWQDFMFACAMYPGDEEYLENVKVEAIDNVKRLRQHPSIALWCGNNENSEGWHRWGWQADKTEAQKTEIWSDYQKVFNDMLPSIVDSLNPSVSYWESSPKYGRGDPRYQFEGDAHDWWVWHDGYPFEHFETAVPRFMSEFGFQAFPSYETIKNFTGLDSIDIKHPSFKNHQKHTRGFELIETYMARDYIVPTQDEDYVYVSQLLQARGISKGIQAHRRAKPYNMGSLYWQLNDCWPVVSWSSIDGLGNWKALHYEAKRVFENTLIVPNLKSDTLDIWLVNDSIVPINATLSVKIKDFNGTLLKEVSKANITVGTATSELKLRLPFKEIDEIKNHSVAEISFGNESALYYFVKPKDLKLNNEKIAVTQKINDQGMSLTLSAKTLQKDVFLYADVAGHYSDNFFDLLPGEEKIIQFFPKDNRPLVTYINTLNRINNNVETEVPSYQVSPIN